MQYSQTNQLYCSINFCAKRRIRNNDITNMNSFDGRQYNEILSRGMIHINLGW